MKLVIMTILASISTILHIYNAICVCGRVSGYFVILVNKIGGGSIKSNKIKREIDFHDIVPFGTRGEEDSS